MAGFFVVGICVALSTKALVKLFIKFQCSQAHFNVTFKACGSDIVFGTQMVVIPFLLTRGAGYVCTAFYFWCKGCKYWS